MFTFFIKSTKGELLGEKFEERGGEEKRKEETGGERGEAMAGDVKILLCVFTSCYQCS